MPHFFWHYRRVAVGQVVLRQLACVLHALMAEEVLRHRLLERHRFHQKYQALIAHPIRVDDGIEKRPHRRRRWILRGSGGAGDRRDLVGGGLLPTHRGLQVFKSGMNAARCDGVAAAARRSGIEVELVLLPSESCVDATRRDGVGRTLCRGRIEYQIILLACQRIKHAIR